MNENRVRVTKGEHSEIDLERSRVSMRDVISRLVINGAISIAEVIVATL